jgi:hypothetical protein
MGAVFALPLFDKTDFTDHLEQQSRNQRTQNSEEEDGKRQKTD